MSDQEQPTIETINVEQEMEIEGEGEVGDYNEDYDDELFDDDAEDEVDAVVQQLGAALWEDINKVYAQQGVQLQVSENTAGSSPSYSEGRTDDETLVNAVQTILDLADEHPPFLQLLSETIVTGPEENTLYDALVEIVGSNTIAPEQAITLSSLIETIASEQNLTMQQNV